MRTMHEFTSVVLFIAFTVHTFDLVWSNEQGDSTGQISQSQMVKNIAVELEVEAKEDGRVVFTLDDIRWLFKKLLFQNCTNKRELPSCNLCVTPEEVMRWYGHPVTTTLTENDLGEYSVGIIYMLSDLQSTKYVSNECESFTNTLLVETKTSQLFDMYTSRYGVDVYGGSRNFLDGDSVDKIVENINKVVGYQLTEKECFTTKDVLKRTNTSKIFGKDKLSHVTTYMMMKLLSTTCLKRDAPPTVVVLKKMFKSFQGLYSEAFLATLPKGDGNVPNKTECYTRTSIVDTLSSSLISERKLNDISPSFVRLVKNVTECGATVKPKGKRMDGKQRTKTWEPWVGSFISISIISFGSLIGILAFRGKQRKYFHHVMSFLVSLGSSVLVCDALLHLIPHALGFHGHIDGRHFEGNSWLWKCLMILIGIYLFILMELTLSVFGFDHGHSHGIKAGEDNNLLEITASSNLKTNNDVLADRRSIENPKFTIKSIKSVAWMILIGDGMHNFMDGVAIGGVFAEPFPSGLQGGIMTSIAIFIHEVPHELGDFAVLISSGLSIKHALILNLISSLTAFIGGVVGIILGTQWHASPWIFAITGGLFIYISLVDMLPEVRRSPLLKTSPKLALFLDFCGLSFGLVIMFILAAYEDKLENALSHH